jgi:hypothetical protein
VFLYYRYSESESATVGIRTLKRKKKDEEKKMMKKKKVRRRKRRWSEKRKRLRRKGRTGQELGMKRGR